MKEIWSEHYRPDDIEGYVFKDEGLKLRVKQWIEDGVLPHVTFCGPAGTGKTTLAFLILKELEVDECDILYINASIDNGVDHIRNQVVGFAETMPFGDYKYVLLDEADYVTHNGQAALRGVMQDFADTTRFILTCNFVGKLMEPIVSRCPPITIDALDVTEFTARAASVLLTEGIHFGEEDLENLNEYVKHTYPDLRKCINKLQLSCVGGKILPFSDDESGSEKEIFLEMISLFKKGQISDARTLVCKGISPDQYVSAYRFLYENVSMIARDVTHECECLYAIKEGLVDHAGSGDPEICLSGTIAKLFIL